LTIERYGGLSGLCEKIKTDPSKGLQASTVEELHKRDLAFGTNKKDKFKRTRKLPLTCQHFGNSTYLLSMIPCLRF
jgi:hypothetical protein